MPPHFHYLPSDKTTIKTRLRIHPDFIADPAAFIRRHDLEIRTAKPTRGRSKRGPTRNIHIDVLRYKGIKVKLRKVAVDPQTDATIHLNPGVCLYNNHNGSVLTLTEFLHALGLIVTHLKPLLSNSADWVDLIPGLRSGGVAYWHYVEVLLQCLDADGTMFASLRNLSPDKAQIPVRHWPDSIRIGGDRSDRLLTIYRKGTEMVAHDKLPEGRLPDYENILRLEMRLKGEKLVQYLGNDRNVESIDGKQRLVRFYPQDLVAGHRSAFGGTEGIFSSAEPLETVKPRDQLVPLGRLLAKVALDPRTPQTFPELLEHLRFYFGASSDTIGEIRKAGLAMLSHRSSISRDDLFSDATYMAQHGIASVEQEEEVSHEIDDTFVHPLIYRAYQPSDQPYQPVTQLPGYHRV